MGINKFTFCPLYPELWDSKSKVSKNGAKKQYFKAVLRGKRSESNFFPQNPDISTLGNPAKVISGQSFVKICTLQRFLVKCVPGGDIFFDILVCKPINS